MNLRTPLFFCATFVIALTLNSLQFASGQNVGGGGLPAGLQIGGIGNQNNVSTDPLAQRIQAASAIMKAQSDYKLAHGEYLNLIAEARKKVAEAVDLELDLWKKKVVVYFERQEENMRSKMRRKDLYDVAKDQTLRLRDSAARRRYEYMKRHPRFSGRGTNTNLNFMLDQFVGTPIGYGISLEEAFESNPSHELWQLNESMHRQLKVKQPNGISTIEFSLSQPTPVAFEWPDVLRDAEYSKYRKEVERINSIVASLQEYPTDEQPKMHKLAAERLQRVFALMARDFFEQYPDFGRKEWSTQKWREVQRGEDFLSQKTVELVSYQRNPERIISASTLFDPVKDGRDAGTLIAFMTRNQLRFSKPNAGDEGAYQHLYGMMMQLYALYGEPLTEIEKTVVSDRPLPPEKKPEIPGVEDVKQLIELP